ncbi:MAG: ATP-binding cassette domain-containing protein [Candidatus Bathyarchaeia archaeon]|jgi:ABC-2 type transport system ATP-binding protein
MAIVRIIDLTKKYGSTLAVDHLNLEVQEGEILGLLGPNGAGKSSVLMILSTIIKPTAGTAEVGGYDVRKNPYEVRELIGIAFQEPKLFWMNTPWEILNWHARVCGVKNPKQKVETMLKELELWDARKKLSHELSGGMKKRVEVAKVLIQRPKVAIVDEPTAQIDVGGKYQIWDMIRALRNDGSTIILATNELSEADRLSDRVAIMFHGRLRICDTPRNLKDSIQGGDVIDIRLDAPIEDKALSELKGIGGIVDLVVVKPTHVRIYLNRAEKMLPKIMNVLSVLGVGISSINMKEPSLDDVFFHYTGTVLDEDNGNPGVTSA